jgi:hypothetical protein
MILNYVKMFHNMYSFESQSRGIVSIKQECMDINIVR